MTNAHFSDQNHRPYLMGFSIIVVFIYHIWLFPLRYDGYDIPLIGHLFGNGYFGVDIFLFLSTYGLSHSFNRNSFGQFYRNRFLRIIPVYIVFTLLTLPVFVNDYKSGERYFFSDSSVFVVPDVEWYTPSLILIYILFPLINKLSKLFSRRKYWEISFLLVFLHVFFYHVNLPIYANLYHRIPIILLGSIYYYLEKRRDNNVLRVSAVLALYGICFSHGCIDRISLAIPAALYVVGKASALPFYKFVSFCGKWSFEIYLAQVISTKYFMKVYTGSPLLELVYVCLITIGLGGGFILVSNYFVGGQRK